MSPEHPGKSDIDARSDLYSHRRDGRCGDCPEDPPGDVWSSITKEAPALGSLAPGLPAGVATFPHTMPGQGSEHTRWQRASDLRGPGSSQGGETPQLTGPGEFVIYPALGKALLLCLAAWRLEAETPPARCFVFQIVPSPQPACLRAAPARLLYLQKAGFNRDISRGASLTVSPGGSAPSARRRCGTACPPSTPQQVEPFCRFGRLAAPFAFSVASFSSFSRTGKYLWSPEPSRPWLDRHSGRPVRVLVLAIRATTSATRLTTTRKQPAQR
jgi:hypothetical protein